MIVAGTGHRPPRLGLGYDRSSQQVLEDFAHWCLLEVQNESGVIHQVISGMAQGWDMALARAALDLKMEVIAAIPFSGQEGRWPAPAQSDYRRLLARCCVVVVSPGEPARWKYAVRDEWMVRHSDRVVALLDDLEEPSGTALTVGYAQKQGKPVRNFWPHWTMIRDRQPG